MDPKVSVVGPLGKGMAASKHFAICENGVISQSRFVDASSAWVSWREFTTRGAAKAVKVGPKKRAMF